MERGSGVLLHISSLPDGKIGKSAYDFIDFLSLAGQKFYQVLPIGQPDASRSPYSLLSSFSGNIDFIDKSSKHLNIDVPDEVHEFALFMALCDYFKKPWYLWEDRSISNHDSKAIKKYSAILFREVSYYTELQRNFIYSMKRFVRYAHDKGIMLIGDLPFYSAYDSCDVWANRNYFSDKLVGGVPPDDFSSDGQMWGFPVYDCEKIIDGDYDFLLKRVRFVSEFFDIIRLDHFRGYESFWAIDKDSCDARNGKWVKSFGKGFIDKLKNEFKSTEFIAEDLGFITQDVKELLRYSNFYSMRVLQFAFDGDSNNIHLPQNHTKNCFCYTGTHDNDTLCGWLKKSQMTNVSTLDAIEFAMSSDAVGFIAPMQDWLEQGSDYRMNTPGSVREKNWSYRLVGSELSNELARKMRYITRQFNR